MKIVSVIAEYNPFHNGHKRQIEYIKRELKPDFTIAFLSGNFTQRGGVAVLDKFTRARHAILAGFDAVIELPTTFATQSAEIFSSGAVKLISSLPCENVLCFGAETDSADLFIKTANLLLNEPNDFKTLIKEQLKTGVSLIDARDYAFKKLYPELKEIISSPNNILGLEYVKTIIKNGYNVTPIILKREGVSYSDGSAVTEVPSAFSIRNAIQNGNLGSIEKGVPPYVFKDLPSKLPSGDEAIIYSLLTKDKEVIKNTPDCAEGLENRIKDLARKHHTLDGLIEEVKSKRYSTSRIKRIILSTALGIDKQTVIDALNENLYLKVLAINSKKTELLSVLSKSTSTAITKKLDEKGLCETALKVYDIDRLACDLYGLITENYLTTNYMQLI